MIEINYNGNNLEFLNQIKSKFNIENCLFRASEFEEIDRISKWGTDRGGFPLSYWENTKIPYDDVIFATTEEDIVEAEKDVNRSSSFKKFAIIENPILLLYDIKGFEKIADRQWLFKDSGNKEGYLLNIIRVIK